MLDADPDLLVIDARLAADAPTVPVGLRGARRAPPDKVDEVAASLPAGTKALVYCAWGFEIGGDCAAKLRERGIDAVAVAGGIGTWRADGLPTEPLKEGESNMKWVTRERPKIDRIACPWLIERFIEKAAGVPLRAGRQGAGDRQGNRRDALRHPRREVQPCRREVQLRRLHRRVQARRARASTSWPTSCAAPTPRGST